MIKRITSGIITCLIIIVAVIFPVNETGAEYFESSINNLSILFEGCNHDVDGIKKVDNGSCHVPLVYMGQRYFDSTGIEVPLSGNGWKYDMETDTLTLNNFEATEKLAKI